MGVLLPSFVLAAGTSAQHSLNPTLASQRWGTSFRIASNKWQNKDGCPTFTALFAVKVGSTHAPVAEQQSNSQRPSVLATDPAERDKAIAEALRLRTGGDNEGALQILKQLATALPHDPIVLLDLGIQAESMQRLTTASNALHAALLLEPENRKILYALARVEMDEQHFSEAESFFQAYLRQRPDDATAHYGLGHLYQMQQQVEKATEQFQRSIALLPVQTESYYQLGQIALDAHRDAEAKTMFEKTLTRMETHGGALTGLGILAYRMKHYSAARESLAKAVASSPEYQPAHYYLGLTLSRLGEKDAAQSELAKAATLASEQQGKDKPVLDE